MNSTGDPLEGGRSSFILADTYIRKLLNLSAIIFFIIKESKITTAFCLCLDAAYSNFPRGTNVITIDFILLL